MFPLNRKKVNADVFPVIYRGGKGVELKRLSVRHLSIMDYLLSNPIMPMSLVAEYFNVTGPWLSTVIHSDLFQARLASRRTLMEQDQSKRIAHTLAEVAEKGVTAMKDSMEDKEVPIGTKHSMAKTALEAMGILGKSAKSDGPSVLNQTNIYQVSPNILAQSKARMERVVNSPLEIVADA